MNIPCIKCKGADPLNSCGRSFCPIIAKAESMFKVQDMKVKEDFFGSSPAPFVGRYGYPDINVGILAPPEEKETWIYDAPSHWANSDFNISRIVDLRSSLVNSRFKANIKDQSKLLDISQEVGIASKPVDLEINLKDKPHFNIRTDPYLAPQGPNAQLKQAILAENPKVDSRVDKVVSDVHQKASEAVNYLYSKDFDENFLMRMLSVGALGVKKSRKLVPTRWSITATDDIIAKNITKEIKDYPEAGYLAFYGGYLGNYYLILMFPEPWSYELFETYMPRAEWNISDRVQYMTDHEPYSGRKSYAENCAGGYYSVRLGILEKLKKMKRQSSVFALRFITGEYAVPLGVWVTREATRKTLKERPIEFASRELMLDYARKLVKKKFGYGLDNLLNKSILIKDMKSQLKLRAFL
mgnify:FL=1